MEGHGVIPDFLQGTEVLRLALDALNRKKEKETKREAELAKGLVDPTTGDFFILPEQLVRATSLDLFMKRVGDSYPIRAERHIDMSLVATQACLLLCKEGNHSTDKIQTLAEKILALAAQKKCIEPDKLLESLQKKIKTMVVELRPKMANKSGTSYRPLLLPAVLNC